jgi:long-chain acyl-CoA synthetase
MESINLSSNLFKINLKDNKLNFIGIILIYCLILEKIQFIKFPNILMKNLLQLLEENKKKFPQKTALSFRNGDKIEILTWKKFWAMVCQTANGLHTLDVKKGDCVGVFSQNSKDWIIFDVAVQMLGAITIPIYATNNYDQTEYIIKQTEMQHILVGDTPQLEILKSAEKHLGKKLHIFTSHVIKDEAENITYFPDFIKHFATERNLIDITDEDLATILYTSGTTGIPKGVMLTHGGFKAVVAAHKEFFNFDNLYDMKSLAFLPLSHIFERSWTLFVLSQGGEVAILEDPKNILNTLKHVHPNAMCAVPRFYEKVYQTLVKKIEASSPTKQKLFKKALEVGAKVADKKRTGAKIPFGLQLQFSFFDKLVFRKIKNELGGNLSFLPCGGAMLKKEISEFFAAIGLPVIVGYGLTETTATVTALPPKNYVYGSVGKALPGVEIKIGADDEILVKYQGVMKGYYKNEEETAKVFTEDGYFRTGDAGRIDEEGNLYITDRIKDLMKTSNGKYIAPQSIEIPLQSNPYIAQAMVIAEGKPYVSAVIVPNFETLMEKYEEFKNYLSLNIEEKKKLLETPFIKETFEKVVNDIQKEFASFEKIKKFKLLPEEFTIERGEITPTLKIKRKIILEKFKALIEGMYA